MQAIWNQLQLMLWNIFHRPTLADGIDILIVAFIIYQLVMLLRETRASAVVKGLLILIAGSWISEICGLTALNWMITAVLQNGAIALIILFQPELRKALETLGRGKLHLGIRLNESADNMASIREITDCLLRLSRRKVGALIVVERSIGLKDVVETGTVLDARISSALLENIFEPNTPLHDGAVIIQGNAIKAAACILTLTENKNISRDLGTRHRAAIGITETTDAVSLIVSEETGIISYARRGQITRHLDREAIELLLMELYQPENESLFTRAIRHTHTDREDAK